VTGGEAQRGGAQRHAVPLADRLDPQRPLQQRLGRRGVVVAGAGARVGQQAGVEHPADHHRDAPPRGLGQQFGQAVLVEQGVPARQQHRVHVGLPDEPGQQRRLVHPGADRADHALGPQPLQRRVRLVQRLRGVVVRVVQVDHVDPVQAQPLQAGLDAAAHPVGAEVPDPAVVCRHREAVGQIVAGGVGYGLQQASDLGRQRVGVARPLPQRGADPAFGQAEAVVRGGVEVPDARVPGGQQRGLRLGRIDLGVEVAERGGAEGQVGDLDRSVPQGGRPHRGSCPLAADGSAVGSADGSAGRSRRPCMPPSTASAVPVTEAAAGPAR